MDKTENVGSWGILVERIRYLGIGFQIDGRLRGVEVARFGVEDINENADVAEDLRLLGGEVVFCEGVLSEMREPLADMFREPSAHECSIK